ncbi:MAG: excalibur calcium-binding domain-containing protein [Rhizobacter sp.]|nr:excalibur calcium-binding domain-containing protein [Rhizobacter sp.]
MSNLRALAIVFVASVCSCSFAAAAQVNKCVIDGTVTYQTVPCPSGETRRAPTVDQLNAERQKKLRQSSDGLLTPTAPPPGGQRALNHAAQSGAVALDEKERLTSAVTPAAPRATTPRCDGRKYCSQMTSCAEAKYFLANCPGVKMDGDRNGIPCEQQWCGK